MVEEKKTQGGWTVIEALKWAVGHLSFCKVPASYIELECLLSGALGCQRKDLLIYPGRALTHDEMERFRDFVDKRSKREPLQYIIGEEEFRGLLFKVNRDVLIPRPETELLVEEAIGSIHRKGIIVLDLCTGSGCIAICVARELTDCTVYAVDISAGTVAVALENAKRHGVADKIEFIVGDIFNALEPLNLMGRIDLILSNPPYISSKDMESLQPEIREYEPAPALNGGEDGLDFYRRIIHGAPAYLVPGGILIMEIGYGQATDVHALFETEGVFTGIEVKKDLAGIDRVIKASYSPEK